MRCHAVKAFRLAGLVLALASLPEMAAAQSTIAGTVTDATGGVLPGVSVEAASPVLIEKTRTVTTNSDGRFTIIDLRPGVYVLTFTLQGFNSVRREGIEVAANVNVPMNVELRVGAVAETITVSGATPVVDVEQASLRQVIPREQLDALPTARSYLSTGAIVPAVKISRPDMGGIQVGQGSYLSARGKSSNDDAVEIDGLDVRISNGVSQSGYNNFGMVQDVTYQTSAIGADSAAGGVRINMIPREGGNALKGDVYLGGSHGWQSNNITDALKTAGLATPDRLKYLIDFNPSIGGPIVKNKLWLFGSGRFNELQVQPAGAHYFATGEPGYTKNDLHNISGRLTFQPTPRNKVTAYIDKAFKSQDHTIVFTAGDGNAPGVDWGTATSSYHPSNFQLGYFKWTSPVTNRLLVESGVVFDVFNVVYNTPLPGTLKPFGTPEWYAGVLRRDLQLNTFVGQPSYSEQFARQPHYALSSGVSYVTGSHTIKLGLQYRYQYLENMASGGNGNLIAQFRNGRPDSVVVYAVPYIARFHANETGIYAMDSWTIGRLTVSPGVRIDDFRGGVDATASPGGRFVPQRSVADVNPVNPFTNINPRLSAVYDLFGNAKTALKFSASRYLTQLSAQYFGLYNPLSQGSEQRIWLDTDFNPGTSTSSGRALATNGDGIPQDNEIGPSTNARFGLAADQRAEAGLKREYSWDYSVGVQHELFPRLSVSAGWYRTRSYDAQRTINALRVLSNYAAFQTASPLNNGEQITLYRLDPLQLGRVDTVVTNSEINHRDYQGFEASVNGRWARGGTVAVGWAMERTRTVSCDTPNPNQFRFCDQTGELYQELGAVPSIPYRQEFKMSASQQLPAGLLVGASMLSYPGGILTNSWAVPPEVFPISRTEVVAVPLIAPGTQYLKRWNQLDLSIRRTFTFGRYQMQPALEMYNILNSSVVLNQNQNFGPSLGRPTSTLQGRLVKLSGLVKF
jgi:hypothetical protein